MALALAALGLSWALPPAAPSRAAPAMNVGFEQLQIANGAEAPLTIGVWYPTAAPAAAHELGALTQTVAPDAAVAGRGLPLVVLSHGGGGSFAGHYDTALARARAGFVAAAVSHAGDTYNDQSRVLELWRRPAQLRLRVTYMLDSWPAHDRMDRRRIGAFGFSNGGFTVLVAAGEVPRTAAIGPCCRVHSDHDLCQALTQAGLDPGKLPSPPPGAWRADPRVRSVVVAAPAFGFAFGGAGLKDVRVPVQLWRAAGDRHQPNPFYDEAVRRALPRPPESHLVAGAGHYDFLPPCGPRMASAASQICDDPSGFDRAAFHRSFNAQVVRFFRETLKSRGPI